MAKEKGFGLPGKGMMHKLLWPMRLLREVRAVAQLKFL